MRRVDVVVGDAGVAGSICTWTAVPRGKRCLSAPFGLRHSAWHEPFPGLMPLPSL